MNKNLKAVFYLLQESATKARDLYVCRVAEKAFTNKHMIYIYTSNPEETQTLDTQLWTFRDISFVPHLIYNSTTSSQATSILPQAADETLPNKLTAPVLIGHLAPPPDFTDILINLNPVTPPFFQQFAHIIEVIPNDEGLLNTARQHYKIYQKQSYKMEKHDCPAAK